MKILTREYLLENLKKREASSHKGTYGTLCSVVGSGNYRGAAVLSASGALRSGVGILRLCSTERVCAAVASCYPSSTFLPLEETAEGMISAKSLSRLNDAVKTANTLLIGCGLGISADTSALVGRLLSFFQGRTIIDADALNIIAANDMEFSGFAALNPQTSVLKEQPKVIITPHVGEMSRLCKKTISEIKKDPEKAAVEYSLKHGCVTVLKDNSTVIAVPNEYGECNTYICSLGNAGLAKGGSGDVLAGLIAGIFTQGYTAEQSACIGVLIHSLAAELCAKERSMTAMLPSELSEYVAKLLADLGY